METTNALVEQIRQHLTTNNLRSAETLLGRALFLAHKHETILRVLQGVRFLPCDSVTINLRTRVVHIDPTFFLTYVTSFDDVLFILYHERNHYLFQFFGVVDLALPIMHAVMKEFAFKQARLNGRKSGIVVPIPDQTTLAKHVSREMFSVLENSYSNAEIQVFSKSDLPARFLDEDGSDPDVWTCLQTQQFPKAFRAFRRKLRTLCKDPEWPYKLWEDELTDHIIECARTLKFLYKFDSIEDRVRCEDFRPLSASAWLGVMCELLYFLYPKIVPPSSSGVGSTKSPEALHVDNTDPTPNSAVDRRKTSREVSGLQPHEKVDDGLKERLVAGEDYVSDNRMLQKILLPRGDIRDVAHMPLLSEVELLLQAPIGKRTARPFHCHAAITSRIGVMSELASNIQRKILVESVSGDTLAETYVPQAGMTGGSFVRFVSGAGGSLYVKNEELQKTVHVYLDVSSSMLWTYPYLNILLGELSFLQPVTYTFSSAIVGPVNPPLSCVFTTSATDFGIVVDHIRDTRPDFVVVVTDLECKMPGSDFQFLKREYSGSLVTLMCFDTQEAFENVQRKDGVSSVYETRYGPSFQTVPSALAKHPYIILETD